MDISEDIQAWIFGAGAIAGLICLETLYFTNAEEVRLLFVLLLIPVGLIGGLLATGVIILLLVCSAYMAAIAVGVSVVAGIVYGLYKIIVWTN